MTKEERWEQMCQEVSREVEKEYLNIPITKRQQMGVEPLPSGKFSDSDSYDRNRWLVCYINLLEWQKKAKSLITED